MKNKKLNYIKTSILAWLVILITNNNMFAQGGLVSSVVSLTGNVINEITRLPETVAITVFDESGEKVTSTRSIANENGYYYLTGLKTGQNYTVRLKKKDFLEEMWKFTVAKDGKYVELSHDFMVKPKEINSLIPVAVPPFEFNKSKLRYGAEFLLEDLKNTLVLNDNVTFQIVCYPDDNKDQAENQRITDERAKSLMVYFTSNGIPATRVTAIGSKTPDTKNPPPTGKLAKGKRYIGPSYIKLTGV